MQKARTGTSNSIRKTSAVILIAIVAMLSGCGRAKSPDRINAAANATGISNKLAAIAVAGEPVTTEQLDKWYVEPPPGENAADIYVQAFAALSPGDATSSGYAARNQKAISLLLEGADRPACRYPVDLKNGFVTLLPHLQKVKISAQLLSGAVNDEMAKGRTDSATKMIEAGISLARSLENEPSLISRLVSVATVAITVAALERSLTHQTFTEEQIMELQQALRGAEGLVSFRRALVGERTTMISGFEATDEDWKKMTGPGQNNQTDFDLTAYKKTAVYEDDFSFALDRIGALIAKADMEFPKALAINWEVPDKRFVLSATLLPGQENVLIRAADTAARLRTAQTALAVERYRLEHANALPSVLAELTPRFLATVPVDPFDGKPLRYKKLPAKGYVIYSIGRDKTDDGGKARAGGKPGANGDVTFTVAR